MCLCVGVGLSLNISIQESKRAFWLWGLLCELCAKEKTSWVPICHYVHYYLYVLACLHLCVSVWGETKTKGRMEWGFVWLIQIAHKSKTSFICQGKFIILYFGAHKTPFICVSTVLQRVGKHLCLCVWVRNSSFHRGSNSVCDVAHNMTDNADNGAQHSGSGLRVWGLHQRWWCASYIVSSLQSSACVQRLNWIDIYITIL